MKVAYGYICGVNSTQSAVEILYRPAGSDEADRPEVIRITPHDHQVHITFLWGGNRDLIVTPGMMGANQATIQYEENYKSYGPTVA